MKTIRFRDDTGKYDAHASYVCEGHDGQDMTDDYIPSDVAAIMLKVCRAVAANGEGMMFVDLDIVEAAKDAIRCLDPLVLAESSAR